MTLGFAGNVTIPTNSVDACNRPSLSEVVIVEGAGTVRRYDLNTLAQNGSNITTIASPSGIALIDPNKVAVASNNLNTVAVVNLVAGTSASTTNMDFLFEPGKAQQMAGQPTDGIGMMCGFTTGTIVKFIAASDSATKITPTWLSGTRVACVIAKPNSSNFIWGTITGQIVETDNNGLAVRAFSVPFPSPFALSGAGSFASQKILSMQMGHGLLFVSTDYGVLYVLAYETMKLLAMYTTSPTGLVMSNIDNVTMLMTNLSSPAPDRQIVLEMDLFKYPLEYKSFIFSGDNIAGARTLGVQGGKAWMLVNSTTALQVYNVTSQRTTVLQTSSATDGGAIEAEYAYIQDNGLVGSASVGFMHNLPAAGQAIPLTASSEYLKIAIYKNGTEERTDIRRVAT